MNAAATSSPPHPAPAAGPAARKPGLLDEAVMITRFHIMLVAMTACVTFSWLMTARYAWALALVVGLDWFLINVVNRVTDIEEDLRNGIPGTERVARRKRFVVVGSTLLALASFVATHVAWPALTPWRLLVQGIGVAYNYKIVPTPRGLTRFKEMYFLKNFASSVLFVLTCFVYPLAVAPPGARVMPWTAVVALALFFVPFELTYEILYDLRDIEGDRQERVPTYPVVHGPERARQIIDALLAGSALVLVVAFVARAIGLRELLMVVAPAVQFVFYRPRYRRGLTTPDCVWLTHLGTAQLILFLAGTALWLRAGLPANVYF